MNIMYWFPGLKRTIAGRLIFEGGNRYKFKVTPYVTKDGVVYSGKTGYSSSIYTLKKINAPKVTKASRKYQSEMEQYPR